MGGRGAGGGGGGGGGEAVKEVLQPADATLNTEIHINWVRIKGSQISQCIKVKTKKSN